MGAFVQNQLQAWQTFDTFINDPRVTYCDEPLGFETVFRNFTGEPTPSHALWTDACRAAFATHAGLTLVTFDKGLQRFKRAALEILS